MQNYPVGAKSENDFIHPEEECTNDTKLLSVALMVFTSSIIKATMNSQKNMTNTNINNKNASPCNGQ